MSRGHPQPANKHRTQIHADILNISYQVATHGDTGGPTNTKLNPTNPILTIIDTEEGILQTSEIAS